MDIESYILGRKSAGGGGGSGLPAVTAADNGDVLTVVNGAWDKAAPSGGTNILIVHDDPDTFTLDRTWQELYDHIANDGVAFIVGHVDMESYKSATVLPIQVVATDDGTSFRVESYFAGDYVMYFTDTADGYPVQTD